MTKARSPLDNARYEVITQEDPETGDVIIPLPEPLLKRMGWKEGDELEINLDENGHIFLKKK